MPPTDFNYTESKSYSNNCNSNRNSNKVGDIKYGSDDLESSE